MKRNEKSELAVELKDKFSKAKVAIFADYKGLSATQADDFRKKLRVEKVEVKVLKNNVARLLVKDGTVTGEAQNVLNDLAGPTMVAFVYGDIAGAAKIVHKFAQDNEALKLKSGVMGSKVLSAASVAELAKLPSREVLLAQVLGAMNGPIRGFVTVLSALPRGLVTALAAIEEKKKGG